MRYRQKLGLCAIVALGLGCGEAKQSPTPKVLINEIDQSEIDQSEIDQSVNGIAKDVVKLEAETEDLKERLKAYETIRSTGAKVESKPNTSEVVSVDLRGIEVTDALASQIAMLDTVVKLTITESAMSVAGWHELGQLVSLQQLDLRDCPLNNEQLKAVIGGLTKLKALRLNGTSGRTTVDDSGLAVLANCPELKVLAIDGLWVGSSGIVHLKGNQKLSELYAAGTTIDDAAAQMLAEYPALQKLRLSKTTVGTPGIMAISRLPLEELDISEASGVSDATLEVVGKMKTLKRLNLWRDTISDAGVAHLAGLTELVWLNVDNTRLGDAGLPHLSQMNKLEFLHLGSTQVTDAGMPSLVALISLKDLKVTRTAVTEAGVEVVRKAIPGIDIQLKYIEGQ